MSAARFPARYGMEMAPKQLRSCEMWKVASGINHGIYGKLKACGNEWHAILHRREPDAWNSKYWWRRVGNHPVFALLAEEAARLGWRAWDPAAFVDACEKERDSGSEREALLREVQRAEWELLFAWCYRHATG